MPENVDATITQTDAMDDDLLVSEAILRPGKVGGSVAARRRRLADWATILGVLALGVLVGYTIEYYRSGPGSFFYNPATSLGCDRDLGRTSWLTWRRRVATSMCTGHTGAEDWAGVKAANSKLTFLVIGDWGRDGFCCQNDVAREMATASEALNGAVKFVLNTGDNFYQAGVKSVKDAQWKTSWRDIYLIYDSLRDLKWWSLLGNHDYGRGNVAPQLEYAKREQRWVMPSTNWKREVNLGGNQSLLFAFFDTSPIFYVPTGEDMMKRLGLTNQMGVHSLAWLKTTLSSSTAQWKFVVGHHPVHSRGSHTGTESANFAHMLQLVKPILEDHQVDAYFCGHDHDMQHIHDNGVDYIVSGAGSQTRDLLSTTDVQGTGKALFGIGRQGFAVVDVTADDTLLLQFLDYKGAMLYRADIALHDS